MNTLHKHIQNSVAIPRYTSYPTAPHFNDSVNGEVVKSWYENLHTQVDDLSLYVHIPFCEKLCLFCGCHMKVMQKYDPIAEYLDSVEKEIYLIKDALKNCPPVKHLHFGGGSPTALSPDDFRRIMGILKDSFPINTNTDISVEIDPRTVNADKMKAYADCGMNRISMGVQDFNEQVQKTVAREQSYDLVKDVIDKLKSQGVKSINMDLMYGLPFQSVETLSDTIEKVVSLQPDRLSVFGYAHVPWMKPHQKLIPEEALAGIEERLEMFEKIKTELTNNGYVAIGLDHFAKADDPLAKALIENKIHRNFQGYTTDNADALVGIGHSSIGSVPNGYMQNMIDPVEYKKSIDAGKLPIKKGISVSEEDLFRRKIINQIMCYMTVDLKNYSDNWEQDFKFELKQIKPFVDDELILLNDGVIKIPDSSRSLIRIIASAFDNYLNNGKGKHSLAI